MVIYSYSPVRINLNRKEVDFMADDLDKIADNWADTLVNNLGYYVMVEALANGENLNAEEVISLFNLAKERDSDIENDIKNYKPRS